MSQQIPFHSKYKAFVDIESTGLDTWRNDICSIGLVVTDNDLNVLADYYDEIRPEFNKFVSEKAAEVHGFSQQELESFKPRKEGCIDMLKFLKQFKDDGNNPLPFIFHANGNFDYRFVKTMFMKEHLEWSLYKVFNGNNLISTIKMGRDSGFKKNGLALWADRLGVKFTHHNSLEDAKMCMGVYKHLTSGML